MRFNRFNKVLAIVFVLVFSCGGLKPVVAAEPSADSGLLAEYKAIINSESQSLAQSAEALKQLYAKAIVEGDIEVAGMALYSRGQQLLYDYRYLDYQNWSKVHQTFYDLHQLETTRVLIEKLDLLRLFNQMRTLELKRRAEVLLDSISQQDVLKNYKPEELSYSITPFDIADIYNYIGLAEHDLGLYDQALNNFGEALSIYETLGSSENIAIAYGNTAMVYAALGDLKQAVKYNEKAIDLSKDLDNSYAYYKAVANNASYYLSQLRWLIEEHGEDSKQAKALTDKIEHSLLNLLSSEALSNYTDIYSDALYWLTFLYYESNQLSKSERYLAKLYDSIKERRERSYLMQVRELEAYILFKKNEFERGIKLLEDALAYYRKEEKKDKMLYTLQDLSWAYEQQGDYKNGLAFQKQYSVLQAELFTEQKSRFLAIEQEKSNAKLREKEIAVLKHKHHDSQLESMRKNQILALSSGLAILIIAVIYFRLRSKQKLAEQYQQLSHIDVLTQLHNRHYFHENIEREFAKLLREREKNKQERLTIFVLDVDHFKKLNDTYGHSLGDKVLVDFAARLKAITRTSDLLVRWGGEEFVLVGRVSSHSEIQDYAERLLKSINSTHFNIEDKTSISVTCSIGGTSYPFFEDSKELPKWSHLLNLADLALYRAKEHGRNRCIIIDNLKITNIDQLTKVINQSLEQSIKQELIKETELM